MHGILTLAVCPSGLRVGLMRVFGPFSRNFFVPWTVLTVGRSNGFLGEYADLRFGQPRIGHLKIEADVADQLANAIPARWPEAGPIAPVTTKRMASRIFRQWIAVTTICAIFFIVVPRVVGPPPPWPPVAVAILLPAVVFGIASIIRLISRNAGSDSDAWPSKERLATLVADVRGRFALIGSASVYTLMIGLVVTRDWNVTNPANAQEP